jgi:GNAT superfamily N-acetyltransferase
MEGIKIEDYQSEHQAAFRTLNEQWIGAYFKLEAPDRQVLEHPQEYILDRGGCILVATSGGEPLGVCALLKRDDLDAYELAKMAVAPHARGNNIGYQLGQAAIQRAIALGATRLYLESSTKLIPAIRLYEKLGFRRVVGVPTPYERADIQMELLLPRST